MPVTSIENFDEFHKVVNSPTPAIVYFWATWAGPCRAIDPIFHNLADKQENTELKFYKLDVDAVPEASSEAGVRATPTFIVFQDGKKLEEIVGANPLALTNLIAKHV